MRATEINELWLVCSSERLPRTFYGHLNKRQFFSADELQNFLPFGYPSSYTKTL